MKSSIDDVDYWEWPLDTRLEIQMKIVCYLLERTVLVGRLCHRLQTAPCAWTQANRRRERASEVTLVPETASECNV
jgi:hypothetical protein